MLTQTTLQVDEVRVLLLVEQRLLLHLPLLVLKIDTALVLIFLHEGSECESRRLDLLNGWQNVRNYTLSFAPRP